MIWDFFCFVLVSFHHRFFFTFALFADFGSLLGGGILSGVWAILVLGLLAMGPNSLIVRAGTSPLCYIDPLPNIDRCRDVYSIVCNNEIVLQTNKQTNKQAHPPAQA